MKTFTDEQGREWTATAAQEEAPRHHGRWYMVIRPTDSPEQELVLPEVRWQSRHTAERSLRTMSDFELRRRLRIAGRRGGGAADLRDAFGTWPGAAPGARGGSGAG